MSNDTFEVALAARAAGEALPGSDAAALERMLRDDPVLRAESAALERTMSLLRSAAVAPDVARRRAALDHVRRRTALRRRTWLAAAAVLLVALTARVVLNLRKPEVGVPAGEAVVSPFDEAFAEALRRPQGETAGPVPAAPASVGGSRGGESPEVGFLGPFAAQADFSLVAPEALPRGASLVAARFRRQAPGVRAFSFAWLEWTTPDGPVVLVQVPAGGAAQEALEKHALTASPLPAGWSWVLSAENGVATIVASPAFTKDQLIAVAGSVEPIRR